LIPANATASASSEALTFAIAFSKNPFVNETSTRFGTGWQHDRMQNAKCHINKMHVLTFGFAG
jgi:hypothetical protein